MKKSSKHQEVVKKSKIITIAITFVFSIIIIIVSSVLILNHEMKNITRVNYQWEIFDENMNYIQSMMDEIAVNTNNQYWGEFSYEISDKELEAELEIIRNFIAESYKYFKDESKDELTILDYREKEEISQKDIEIISDFAKEHIYQNSLTIKSPEISLISISDKYTNKTVLLKEIKSLDSYREYSSVIDEENDIEYDYTYEEILYRINLEVVILKEYAEILNSLILEKR